MNRAHEMLIAGLCLALGACATTPMFQKDVMDGVEPNFNLNTWRTAPNAALGHKIQVGGRIVQADLTEEGVLIVGMQLPIVEHPVYGPTEVGKRPGVFEFAFLYTGKMEASALSPGNRFIVVGTIQRARIVEVDGAPKSEPFLLARCVRIWKTEGREIADFPMVGAGYYPLEENTYCTSGK